MATDRAELLYKVTADGTQAVNELNKLTQAAGNADARMQQLGQSATKSVGSSQLTQNIKNTSYQFQDFVTQVSNGQNATVALGQQLPQLLGSFGALGAVLGVAAALIPAVVAAFQALSDEGEKLDVIAKRLDTSIGDMTKSLDLVDRASFDGLVEKYKTTNKETQKLILANLELKKTLLQLDSADYFTAFRKSLKTAVTEVSIFKRAWQELQISIDKSKAAEAAGSKDILAGNNIGLDNTLLLTKEWGISKEQLDNLQRMKDLFHAGKIGAAEYALSINELAKNINAKSGSLREFVQAESESINRQVQAAQAQKETAELLDRLNRNDTTTTADIKKNATEATKATEAYLKLIHDLTTKQDQLKAQSKLLADQDRDYLQIFKDLTESQKARIAYDRDITDGMLKHNEAQQALVRGLLDENAALEKNAVYKQAAAKLLSKTPAAQAQEEYNKALAQANFLHDAGAISAAEYAASIDQAKLKLAESQPLVVGLSAAFSSFISGVVIGGQSFSQAIANMAKSIANLVIQILIIEPLIKSLKIAMSGLGGFFGGGGGGAQAFPVNLNAYGNSFLGGTGLPHGVYTTPTLFKFANGGAFGGRTGLMGEAGPEAIVPLKRHGSKLGVSSSPVVMNIYNNVGAEVQTKTTENADGSKQIDIYIEKKVREMVSNGNLDRAMRGSYGLSRVGA